MVVPLAIPPSFLPVLLLPQLECVKLFLGTRGEQNPGYGGGIVWLARHLKALTGPGS